MKRITKFLFECFTFITAVVFALWPVILAALMAVWIAGYFLGRALS